MSLEAFGVATGAVALAEIGDKTQLLSLVLASRFGRPVPIVLGILVATLVNHALAGLVGAWISDFLGPELLRWVIGLSFIAMAGWVLVPDRLDEGRVPLAGAGVFIATTVAFFFAEMGDKTQIATVALAAQYDALVAIVAGTTLGMLIANVPVVWLGERATRAVPIGIVRVIAAVLFVVLGVAVLLGLG